MKKVYSIIEGLSQDLQSDESRFLGGCPFLFTQTNIFNDPETMENTFQLSVNTEH